MPGAAGHNPFDPDSRLQKVERIFKMFDANEDGYLNREEMAALVMAVNPRVRFTQAQINAILNEVFRGYGEFIAGDKGLRLDGLLRTYNDGAGDVDRDFEALGLKLEDDEAATITTATDDDSQSIQSVQLTQRSQPIEEREEAAAEDQVPLPVSTPPAAPDEPASIVAAVDDEDDQQGSETSTWFSQTPERKTNVSKLHSISSCSEIWSKIKKKNGGVWPPSWTASPNNGIAYADTWHIVEDLDTLVRRAGSKSVNTDLNPWFHRALGELCQRADCCRTQDEAFDAHMAMGRCLFDHGFFDEALARFQRAIQLRPTDVRPYFRSGNSLCSLGRFDRAVGSFEQALESARTNGPLWSALLPQIHVNLGISLEEQGMLLGACEQYREAAIQNPRHYRALKLLGSALLGVGEYRAAEKALREAVAMKPEYGDARCDLGSVLHAIGESEKAIVEFNKAIELQPQHCDALYNLGGCLRDSGKFAQAVEIYSNLLAMDSSRWQAHLNKAVSLLGMGEVDRAVESMKQALKLTNRVEIFDELKHLKCMQTNPGQLKALTGSSGLKQGGLISISTSASMVPMVDPSRFLKSSSRTTPSLLMRCALEMRAFQRHTRFNRCSAGVLANELSLPSQMQLMRKSELEKIIRSKLLPFLPTQAFQFTIKSVNERVFSVLDAKSTGKIDPGMFLALIAPICSGDLEARKRVAFDLLVWRVRSSKKLGAEISRADAKLYFRNLKMVFMPLQSRPDDQLWQTRGEDENTNVAFPEFVDMFEESSELSFGNILETLRRLESGDRNRHGGICCSVCSYEIVGARFREVSANFNLCSMCYSEGKVPPDMIHEEYFCFKEYGSEVDAIKEKLLLFGSKVPKFA